MSAAFGNLGADVCYALRGLAKRPLYACTIALVLALAIGANSTVFSVLKETVYWHFTQRTRLDGAFMLRTTVPPEQLARIASATVAALDPDLALFDAASLDTRMVRSMGAQRTPMVLTVVFAIIALMLAVVGIYAVLSWAVTQRSGEIGVRMALGARASDVVAMVLQQGARVIALGLALGVGAALGLGRALAARLPDVEGFDATVLAVALVALGGAALVATWLPARRAARIDPLRALRSE